MKRTYAHIVNPVNIGPPSDLVEAQPITFESMRRARAWSGDKLHVEMLSVQYPEDHSIVPEDFRKLPDLERSVLDVASFNGPQRKLPLIVDIMDLAHRETEAEYLIYTNVDIAVMPFFYDYIDRQIERGCDAVVVNRRRIPARLNELQDLSVIYATMGEAHPGYDCFVIHRDLYPKFKLGEVCIGIPFIGVSFAHNLFSFAQKYHLADREHLSMHIGKRVFGSYDNDYYRFNKAAFERVKAELRPHFQLDKFPYSELGLFRRMMKWGLNPSLSIRLWSELESEGFRDKLAELFDNWRFRFLSK